MTCPQLPGILGATANKGDETLELAWRTPGRRPNCRSGSRGHGLKLPGPILHASAQGTVMQAASAATLAIGADAARVSPTTPAPAARFNQHVSTATTPAPLNKVGNRHTDCQIHVPHTGDEQSGGAKESCDQCSLLPTQVISPPRAVGRPSIPTTQIDVIPSTVVESTPSLPPTAVADCPATAVDQVIPVADPLPPTAVASATPALIVAENLHEGDTPSSVCSVVPFFPDALLESVVDAPQQVSAISNAPLVRPTDAVEQPGSPDAKLREDVVPVMARGVVHGESVDLASQPQPQPVGWGGVFGTPLACVGWIPSGLSCTFDVNPKRILPQQPAPVAAVPKASAPVLVASNAATHVFWDLVRCPVASQAARPALAEIRRRFCGIGAVHVIAPPTDGVVELLDSVGCMCVTVFDVRSSVEKLRSHLLQVISGGAVRHLVVIGDPRTLEPCGTRLIRSGITASLVYPRADAPAVVPHQFDSVVSWEEMMPPSKAGQIAGKSQLSAQERPRRSRLFGSEPCLGWLAGTCLNERVCGHLHARTPAVSHRPAAGALVATPRVAKRPRVMVG
mmetsp:Transcript_95773/g.219526  ORF Transcript_95773/g.219526 Transcript_95773/m.219526 type:complete len:566 (+) Transcript_95773:525-2222(+)